MLLGAVNTDEALQGGFKRKGPSYNEKSLSHNDDRGGKIMGQKIHPKGLRLGINEDWDSSWYAEGQDYCNNLDEDIKLRKYMKRKLYKAGISRIRIARRANQIEIILFTARPGLIIGKGGRDVAFIREEIVAMTKKQVQLDIQEE